MNPISNTAFYCCGVRMQDAESSDPVCGDTYAKVFMNEDGLRIFENFKDETRPNASSIARPRIIDDFLRQELADDPSLTIILIGAGFDSRAFRLNGGIWIEFDEPQIISYKDKRLPVTNCPNELHRIPIDFLTDSLEEKLAPFLKNSPVVFVIEGVFMYLEENGIEKLLQTLRRLFPQHKLICDLMSRNFFEKYSKSFHEKITGMGTSFKFTANNPEKIFLKNGYICRQKISVIESAIDYKLLEMPKILLKTAFRTLANGYSVFIFNS